MTVNVAPPFQTRPKIGAVSINNADGTTAKTLWTAGIEGGLIDNIAVTTDDTSDVTLELVVNDGTTDFKIGEVVVKASAGNSATAAAKNLLDATALPFLQSGGGLPLAPNHLLKVNAKAAVTSGKTVKITAFGGDYDV